MTYTLKMYNAWQITLPKRWRSQYDTEHFVAIENEDGSLIIKPMTLQKKDNSVYYENEDWFGVYFPDGVPAQDLLMEIEKLNYDN